VRFKLAMDVASASIPEKVTEVIKTEFTLFPLATTPSSFNEDFLSKHSDSARHIFACLRVRQLLQSHEKSKSESEILASLNLANIKLTEAIEGLEILSLWKSSTESYILKANSIWPEATIFKAKKDL